MEDENFQSCWMRSKIYCIVLDPNSRMRPQNRWEPYVTQEISLFDWITSMLRTSYFTSNPEAVVVESVRV